MKLSQDQILAAAFALLEADGLDAFSMRKLAPTLNVQPPALYWHVGGKGELLSLMAGAIYAEARAAIPQTQQWAEWLAHFGRALRRAFMAHRDSARLCAGAGPVIADSQAAADAIAAPLIALGLDRTRAISYQASVISLALGWSLYAQSAAMHDFLYGLMDFEASFDTGLAAMIHGFASLPAPIAAGEAAAI